MIKRFNRYELKYLITAEDRDALLEVMKGYMKVDQEGAPDGVYQVSSLYFDTHDYSAYRAKVDGVNYRRKLRIRRYGKTLPGPSDPVMVEIKQRINRTTQKRRLALPLAEAQALCDRGLDQPLPDAQDEAVAQEVSYLVGAQQLGPKCMISYRRRAWVGSIYEPGLRITFDEELRVSAAHLGLAIIEPAHLFLPPERIVLEVKTNDVMPLWVSRLLASRSCIVARYSKYCAGIARLHSLGPGAQLTRRVADG